MEKYLKWEDCDKTITEPYPKSGKVVERKVTRELTCSHPQVDECWQWGGYDPSGGNMAHHLEIVRMATITQHSKSVKTYG